MNIVPLAQCVDLAAAGPKAVRLAQARAAGFPVLDGVVVLPDAALHVGDLAQRLAGLNAPFAVRSSARGEDGAQRSGAGVFQSVLHVELAAVPAAIERVRASAHSPRARAYTDERSIAVLLQPMVMADKMLVAMSDGDGFLVEERAAAAPEWSTPSAHSVTSADPLGQLLARLARFFAGPIVAELAQQGATFTLLQVRPRPELVVAQPLPDSLFAVAGSWLRDAHNPTPLSTAQAELVARVERLEVGPEQRVIGGYLFVSTAPARPEAPWREGLAERYRELARSLFETIATARAEGSLGAALAAYDTVYRHYTSELAPSRRSARMALDELLQTELGESLDAHGPLLDGAGGASFDRECLLWALDDRSWDGYVTAFGSWAPGWDVALATDGESRKRVERLAQAAKTGGPPEERRRSAERGAIDHAAQIAARLSPSAQARWPEILATARLAVRIGEDDDALFFAAQHAVREALIRRGQALVQAGRLTARDHVFDLRFELPDNVTDAVNGARLFTRRARATRPPDAIDDGIPRPHPPFARILRGRPTTGRAHGRVTHLDGSDPQIPSRDAVVWLKALLPSLSPLLSDVAALITEEGGVASHGALLARERGLVAVIGVGPAQVAEGAEVIVDGDAGEVHVL